MSAPLAGSTPRPWSFDPGSEFRVARVYKKPGQTHNGAFVPGASNRYHDGMFIVYAVNHIEQAEAALAEARQLVLELLTITQMRGGKGPLVDEARDFLARTAPEVAS